MRTLLIALLLPACAAAQSTATTTLSVTVASAATISLGSSSTALTASTTWGDYTGTTSGAVRMRTSKTGGSGSVTVEITSAFASGGPGVDDLTYTCSVDEDSEATACSGSVTASDSSGTTVLSMGADGHSADTGDTFSVEWSLKNLPSYTPGSYSATATFTVSAT